MTLHERLLFNRSEKKSDQKKITYIPIDKIRPNPYQPRRNFDQASLEELCNSIKEYGVIQPINVRKTPSNYYELVSGERRLRASIMAGLKEIPAIIIDVNEDDLAIMALIENLQREDLGYWEEAEGYRNLIKEHGLTQEELAQKLGKSQSTIANKIRLLRLSPMVRKILTDHKLTERHARALLKLPDEQLQLKVLQKVIEKDLNVKKTEELVQKVLDKYTNPQVQDNEKKISHMIKDIRIFVNTIKQAIEMMKKAGVNAKAAQIDRGEFVEFIVRIPKKDHSLKKAQ
ncbi:nucleoid occlusion protein [Thermoclostridium stercorarium subsp. thermolacticum DSM 2910]|jgi:ParB family chromosome partitioning protein|uniref:Nucleoid occlusion protein n=1 Tax=Thermoclostridium stercorarium subsp. thermolacticum DSM 2910 TaxID=1121336 RepID=A0A1B1YGP0_THEST|nr:nucleoid occlusion protein [Thermoclostridium stercorarium]AGI40664.1 partition protein [Thermoclostridium stercorarium subsp. stercorarium DSM 8532]ANW99928.1 nucleoid occlusion protein [Thermoclostridium stercorarium subsp. thermolacticum DSM 2910]